MQNVRNLARGTAVIYRYLQRVRRLHARDPDPDVEVRQAFLSIMRNCIFRNHFVPRKLYVPKNGFPTALNYIDVLRQTKTSIDVFHEATIDDYWNIDGNKFLFEPWIAVTRFELPDKDPPEGHLFVGSRQTNQGTGYYNT